MRVLVVAIILCVFVAPIAAQTPAANEAAKHIHKGNVKIALGVALVAAGAFMVPITSVRTPDQPTGRERRLGLEMGLMGFGGGLILWGAQQRLIAARPQTHIGVTLGRGHSADCSKLVTSISHPMVPSSSGRTVLKVKR